MNDKDRDHIPFHKRGEAAGVNPNADMPFGGDIPPTQAAAANALADVAARGIALIDREIEARNAVHAAEDLLNRVVGRYVKAGIIEPNKVYVLDGRCLVITVERDLVRVVMLPTAEKK